MLSAMADLSSRDLGRWNAWRRASETVRAGVAADVTAATGLSDPDYGVLSRVAEADGSLRQNALADSMGWSRSRLSHHLSRMEERGLVRRSERDGGVVVGLTPRGRRAESKARPVHATAVQTHLISRLSSSQRTQLDAILARLAGD